LDILREEYDKERKHFVLKDDLKRIDIKIKEIEKVS
jgi:hypothetical protein